MAHTIAAHRFLELAVEVLRLHGSLIRTGDALVADLGLSAARWRVLGSVIDRPSSVARIARTIGRSRQSVQCAADRLVADGLAEFVSNPDHRRSPLLGLTGDGSRAMAEVRRRQADWANRMAEGLGDADLVITTRTLAALSDRLTVRGDDRAERSESGHDRP